MPVYCCLDGACSLMLPQLFASKGGTNVCKTVKHPTIHQPCCRYSKDPNGPLNQALISSIQQVTGLQKECHCPHGVNQLLLSQGALSTAASGLQSSLELLG